MSDPYWKFPEKLPAVRMRSNADGGLTMFGRFISDGEWAEIRSEREGHFLEQTSLRAFSVSIHENRDRIRCIFHHGTDPYIGMRPLGVIRSLEADSSYEVDLFAVDYVRSLVPGLKAGQYGASFRCRVVRDEIEPHPQRSSWNPNRIPQVKIVQADLVEFGPTAFPAYSGTTAAVRTGLPVLDAARGLGHGLEHGERWVTRDKPGAPGVIERERVLDGELASWEDEMSRNWWYLSPSSDPRMTTLA
jgi:phage head maturation protease